MSSQDGSVPTVQEATHGTRSWSGGGENMTSEAEPAAMEPGATELTGQGTGLTGEKTQDRTESSELKGQVRSGDQRVDAALSRLGELPGTPVAAHVEVFAQVH